MLRAGCLVHLQQNLLTLTREQHPVEYDKDWKRTFMLTSRFDGIYIVY